LRLWDTRLGRVTKVLTVPKRESIPLAALGIAMPRSVSTSRLAASLGNTPMPLSTLYFECDEDFGVGIAGFFFLTFCAARVMDVRGHMPRQERSAIPAHLTDRLMGSLEK
jgi:hypothetical protein